MSRKIKQHGKPDTMGRRDMLKVAGLAAGSALLSQIATSEAKAAPSTSDQWDREFDVIIAGSGFAGCAAAIAARREGASTLVIEKMSVFGGNSAINGGAMAVAGSALQKEKGINDSVELMMADMLKGGRGTNHVDLLRVVCAGTAEAFEMTREFGVKWKDVLLQFGGHSVQRTFQTEHFTGGDITIPLMKGGISLGAIFKNRCKLEEILTDMDGGIAGIVVREDYYFPDENSGTLRRYKVNRGFVACTGGFGSDIAFRKTQNPSLDESVGCTNHRGATAESFNALLEVNAAPVNTGSFQLGPWASPDESGFGYAPQFNQQAAFPYGIMVDIRDGLRFVNENADRKTRADAQLKHCKEADGTIHYPVAFCSEPGTVKSPTVKYALKEGVAWKFDSLEALANNFGIPLKPLQEQVDRFKQFVANGKDEEFGKPIFGFDRALYLDKPPYYAMRAWPKVHFCQGGVNINPRAEVTHMRTGQPIPKLYAAGEITGGTHGESRLGSCAIAETLVMGTIAGKNAARNKARS
ncbi:Urocanate reductase precursor [Pseudodesulfovibrio hydrargyri]|uniref:Urocanate reductase n=1 Tax=Pseudodesulfovibrio hydrargyri TaxID=2125990 RepID=A0A1J5MYH8_9BACT|nr:flavocytochrome c [Pseudodesulfovibrio hydrargyri]OIQ50892.1 Urocanate reductase precursor [Pseudodesulfovibrio hydrargyri]